MPVGVFHLIIDAGIAMPGALQTPVAVPRVQVKRMVTQHQESPQHTHYPGLYSELDGAGTIPWPYGGHGQQRGYVRLGKRVTRAWTRTGLPPALAVRATGSLPGKARHCGDPIGTGHTRAPTRRQLGTASCSASPAAAWRGFKLASKLHN